MATISDGNEMNLLPSLRLNHVARLCSFATPWQRKQFAPQKREVIISQFPRGPNDDGSEFLESIRARILIVPNPLDPMEVEKDDQLTNNYVTVDTSGPATGLVQG